MQVTEVISDVSIGLTDGSYKEILTYSRSLPYGKLSINWNVLMMTIGKLKKI